MGKIKEHNSGIYVIEIIGSPKFYIGSTLDLARRERDHERLLLKGTHKNLHLQNAFNKHGVDSYKFRIIAICEKDKDFLLTLEQKIIDSYDWDELFNFNRFTRVTNKGNDVSYEYIKGVFEDTANSVSREEILEKYNISKGTHRNIIIRKSYSWIKVDKDIVKSAQDSLRKCDRYSKEELGFIRDNHEKGLEFLSENLGRTEVAVRTQLSRMKLVNSLILSNEDIVSIIKLADQGSKINELVKEFCKDRRTIYRVIFKIDLKKLGIDQSIIDSARFKIKSQMGKNGRHEFKKLTPADKKYIKNNCEKYSINKIVEYLNKPRSSVSKVYKQYKIVTHKWSEEQDKFLLEKYITLGPKRISLLLGKTPEEVSNRIAGIKRKNNLDIKVELKCNQWTDHEVEYLINNFEKIKPKEIAKYLNKSESSIYSKYWKIQTNYSNKGASNAT